jgi:dTDP-4-amino-4,6-dideoxygalactose transaminase
MKIDFFRHSLTPNDVVGIEHVLATPFLTSGAVCKSVEARIAAYFSVPHATLVNSWTNGALAVLLAMDIKAGDEVIVPASTFIATANVVELTGARPVFADVDPETLLMRPEDVAPLVNERTRAVIPVHLYGQMCDVAGLRAMLDAHPKAACRISILEDAAHCFEGLRNGERPGMHSDATAFSFYATKNITCGEGGAVITRDAALHQRILEARLHGMSAIAADRFAGGHYNHWDMMRLGTKANLPDILAALLPRQIEVVDSRLLLRTAVADRYRAAFAGGPLRLVAQRADCVSAEHIFPLGVPGGARDAAIAALNAAGVPVTVNYRSVPGTTYYRGRYGDQTPSTPVSHRWGLDTLTLPLYPDLRADEQDYIIATVQSALYPLVTDERPNTH